MPLPSPSRRPSRRRVLGLGLLGAAGHLARPRRRTAGGPGPSLDPVHPVFSLAGGAVPNGVLVRAQLSARDAGRSVELAVWRADGTGPTKRFGPAVADADSIARIPVTGRLPSSTFYAQLVSEGQRVGDRLRFTTMPASTGSWVRRIGVVSCQNNALSPLTTDLAWRDLAAWQPHSIWHLGDWGYWGQEIPVDAPYTSDLAQYVKCMTRQPTMRKAIESASLDVVTISDHELSANGDPPGGIHNSPESIRELIAFQKLFPVRTYGDTRSPRRGRYYSFDIGSAVRVIVTDFRTPDRSNIDDDGPDKTMFGATQLAWIFDTFDETRLNVLVNETSWLADPNDDPGGKRTDKPWTYYQEQLAIAEHITTNRLKVAWVGGDRHYVGYLRGTDDGSGVYNSRGGFPCYISSGMSKNQLALQDGELMTWQHGAGPDLTKQVCGYLRLTMSYDAPSGVVSLHAQGRAVLDTTKPMKRWQIRDVPRGTAVDSWRVG